MDNPVLVEVTRGDYVESVHRGAIAIVDGDGKVLAELGDINRPIFPRSAIKPLQALYLVESGAADHFGLGAADIALACSSHNGENMHTQGVSAMLAEAGLDHECLECGTQWPTLPLDRQRLMKADLKPGALHNNCSGKHAGFICAAHHLGQKVEGYVKPDHTAQQDVKAILEALYHYKIKQPAHIATDGCSIPTYAVPLKNMAQGLARFVTASNMGAERDKAARKIYKACVAHPDLVAGTKRFDTDIMQAFGTSVLVKTGAEGVYAGAIPNLGLGIALKCEDGATRASEAMMAACLAALMKDQPDILQNYLASSLKNRNGWQVGTVRVAEGVICELGRAIC